MPDIYDQAQKLDGAERDACVAIQLAKPGMKATGFCHDPGCGAPLPKGQMFCGKECRDYYEKQERMNRIQGKQ
ncbi:MAG: hypothetical protein ACYCZT_10645 [Thiobacillus sp.]